MDQDTYSFTIDVSGYNPGDHPVILILGNRWADWKAFHSNVTFHESLDTAKLGITIVIQPKIIATADEGGSISPPGKTYVDYGGNQSYTITPDKYWKIKDLKVDGTSKGAKKSYKFSNVTEDHKIHASFEPITGKLKIQKRDFDSKRGSAQGDATLKTTKFDVVCVDSPFYTNNSTVATLSTDANGAASVTLKGGKFKVKETTPSTGYLHTDTSVKTFEIDEDGETIDLTNETNSFYNKVQRGSVTVRKCDQDFYAANNKTDCLAPEGDATFVGITYRIQNLSASSVFVNGTEYAKNAYMTGIDQTISSDANPTVTFSSLPYGTYKITELSVVNGYRLNTGWSQTIEIRSNGQVIDKSSADDACKDSVWRGSISVRKCDRDFYDAGNKTDCLKPEGNATFVGVKFRIQNLSAHPVIVNGKKYAVNALMTDLDQTISSDTNPTVTFSSLPYGTYKITELSVVNGYHLNSDWSKTIQIRSDGQMVDLTSADDACKDAVWRGNITVCKADDSLRVYNSTTTSYKDLDNNSKTQPDDAQGNATLSGAQFVVVNRSTYPVSSPQYNRGAVSSGGVVCVITSDSTGKAATDDAASNGWSIPSSWRGGALAYGDYEVFEVKAPIGYMLGHYHGDSVRYYSLCTQGATTPLLTGSLSASQQSAFKFANSDPLRNTYVTGAAVSRITPSSSTKWVSSEGARVSFSARGAAVGSRTDNANLPSTWAEDTVQRGNIEVIKADDSLRTYNSSDPASQGNSTLGGAIYAVVNRSSHCVVAPDTGNIVQPNGLVCKIKTDDSGFATTANSRCGWSVPTGWHGALAYGDYEVFEIEAPTGYLLGHHYKNGNNDEITYYSLRTTNSGSPGSSAQSVLSGLSADNAKSRYGFANTNNQNTFVSASTTTIRKIVPSNNTSSTWVSTDKTTVRFTKRQNALPADLRTYENLGENWSEDTIKRGDIEIIKADDSFRTYKASRTTTDSSITDDAQGNSSLGGAVYSVVNRSNRRVLSPETGELIQPGAVVCHVKTDVNGFATTANSRYGWDVPTGWFGALAFGDYEVFEIEAPVGYLLGHHYKDGGTDKITYYSMRTINSNYPNNTANSVLEGLSNDTAKNKYGFANTNNRNTFLPGTPTSAIDSIRKITPSNDADSTWISDNSITVRFTKRQNSLPSDLRTYGNLGENWSEDTVKRGNIEIIKADDTFRTYKTPRTTTDSSIADDAQGNATLGGAVYSVVNRSKRAVLSPENGQVIQPGEVVCHIKTDENGFATTASSRYGWNVPAGWFGALAYGDYEVFEIEAPVGYLLGHHYKNGSNDEVTYYSMRTTDSNYPNNTANSVLPGLTAATAKSRYGFANTSNQNTFVPSATVRKITPSNNTDSTWISDNEITVRFTKRQNSLPSDLRTYENLGENWSEDTVKRGDIEIIKADDSFRTYKAPRTTTDSSVTDDAQGNATLAGAVYSVVNRSKRAVLSPETGAVVQPGEVVCHIRTDTTGFATTADSRYGWSVPSGWFGALAFGDYEIFEIEAPVGYLLGHHFKNGDNDEITYYSMRTIGSNYPGNTSTSVLEGLNNAQAKSRYDFANTNNRNTFLPSHPSSGIKSIRKITPSNDADANWVSDNEITVRFTRRQNLLPSDLRTYDNLGENWSEDTVKRGNIEIIKADDTLKTYNEHRTTTANYDDDAQGNATLEGAVYSVVNRSKKAVLSPESGEVIQPGQVICNIKTDSRGFATTADSRCGWNVPAGWHGALPYGDYELFEIEAPVGYMLGHWNGADVTYYSLCTDHGSSAEFGGDSLLCGDNGDVNSPNLTDAQAKAFRFEGASNIYDKEYLNKWFYGPKDPASTVIKRTFPNASSQKWVDDDAVTVSFTTRDIEIIDDVSNIWSEDTVKRADIELHKADDTFNTDPVQDQVVDYAGRTKPQGDASLEDARFAIINRSKQAIVNPFGQLVQPGRVVCFIYTDADGYASTKLTPERIKRNRWDQETTTAVNGLSYGANGIAFDGVSTIFAVAKGWHGALPYGEYEVFEVEEPEGYLNGHWFNDSQIKWAAMAVSAAHASGAERMATIAGTSEFKAGFRNDYPSAFDIAYATDAAVPEWYRIYANSEPHKWVEVDNFEWYNEKGYPAPRYPSQDSYSDEVSFTRDALLNGSSHKVSLDSYARNESLKKEQRFEDTVMRGNIDLYKADDSFADSRGRTDPEGNATLEGAVFQIVNRSTTFVVSPQTGKEIAPGDIVCSVVTDANGFASTELSPERISINRWDKEDVTGYTLATGECFATKNGWHAALAYGEYEVYESDEPIGYLLNHWKYDRPTNWCGMAVKLNHRNKYYTLNGNTEIYPNSQTKWIDHNKSLVTFTSDDHWFEDTPERGDIELYKADDTLNTTPTKGITDTKGRTDEQGDASLEGAVFKIVNRSEHPVVSPENGREVEPGDVVCTIITDENGFASTKLTAERMSINHWQEAGNPNSHSYAQEHGWHYALPYGEYEVYEHQASEGYLVGHWFNDEQTKYAGMAIAKSNKGVKRTLFGNHELYPSVTRNGWANDDIKSWINDEGVLVEFTNDEQWFEDTVERGDLDLYKADDTLNTDPTLDETDIKGRSKPQGDATLEGAVFKIINRSDHVIVSPEDGREVSPGEIVCTLITDENGYASTSLSSDRLAINQWANDCYAVSHGWHGALAFGEYEVYEYAPPEGYLHNHWDEDSASDWAGMAVKDDNRSVKQHKTGNTEIYPSSTYKWVNRDKALVSFATDGSRFEDTVKRGDLDLQKADSDLERTEHGVDIEDRQGRAHLENAVYGIYNRSKTVVVSPQTGKEVWPTGEVEPVTGKVSDGLVCTIVTDGDGYASTELSPERMALNKWDSRCIAAHEKWRGALAYGQYEVIEITPPEGYLLNKSWHGMAVKYNADGSATQNPRATTAYSGNAAPVAGKPNSLDSNATWVYEDRVLISFGSTKPMISSRDHVNCISWAPDHVIRGGIRIGAVDRQNQDYKPQGSATLTGIKIGVYSTNPHPVYIKNEDGSYTEHAKWLGADGNPTGASLEPSGDFVVSPTKSGDIQTEDGVLVRVIEVKIIEEDGEIKYVASTNPDPTAKTDDSLPYGTYRLKALDVPEGSGYLFDNYTKDWYQDFAIGSDFDTGPFTSDDTLHTTVTPEDACKEPTTENEHAWIVDLTREAKYCVSAYVMRGDIEWKKIAEEASGTHSLGWIPFLVTSLTTGESHIVVTDSDGNVSTANNERFASSANCYTYHSYQTNGNDYMLTKNANGIPVLTKSNGGSLAPIASIALLDPQTECIVDESGETPDFHPEYGYWFNGRTDVVAAYSRETRQNQLFTDDATSIAVDDSVGALPYDTYIIQEILVPERVVVDAISGQSITAPSNTAYYMVGGNTFIVGQPPTEKISEDGLLTRMAPVSLGTIANEPRPILSTTMLSSNGLHLSKTEKEVSLTDTLTYMNIHVNEDTKYKVQGELHLVEYDSEGNKVDGGVLVDATGKEVRIEKDFEPKSESGSVDLTFTFDASQLANREVVAYETVIANGTEWVASHNEITDQSQTVSFPTMTTTLSDIDGRKEASAVGKTQLKDVIHYEKLVSGTGYTAHGTLYVRDEKGNISPAKDKDGNTITADKSFGVSPSSTQATVTFSFEAPDLAGKTLVAFEELSYQGTPFLSHEDKDDASQTIYMPGLDTAASDGLTGLHYGLASEDVEIYDEVSYQRLQPAHTYHLHGQLMDADTGEPLRDANGNEITSSATFTPGSADAYDIAALRSKLSEIGYDVDGDGDKELFSFSSARPGDTVTLPASDSVQLADGYEMKISFDPDYRIIIYTQNRISQSDRQDKFVIQATSVQGDTKTMYDENGCAYGEIVMRFNVPAETVSDKTVVVYEQLYADLGTKYDIEAGIREGVITPVAVHEDRMDEGQSVTYPDISHTVAADAETGQHYGLAYDTVRINDTVSYTRLVKGNQYTLVGTLYDRYTEVPILDSATGGEIKGEVTFTADDGNQDTAAGTRINGSATVSFECTASSLRGKTAVVYEDLYFQGKRIGTHSDISDADQSVTYPDVHTEAKFGNGEKSGLASRDTALIDTIYYEKLEPGVQYKAVGTVHFKGTDLFGNTVDDGIALDPDGNPITDEVFFTPDAPSGQVDVVFNCNAATLQFRDAVFYETVYAMPEVQDGSSAEYKVAVHEDIADESQTVSFRESDIESEMIYAIPEGRLDDPMAMAPTGDIAMTILRKLAITVIASIIVIGSMAVRRRMRR